MIDGEEDWDVPIGVAASCRQGAGLPPTGGEARISLTRGENHPTDTGLSDAYGSIPGHACETILGPWWWNRVEWCLIPHHSSAAVPRFQSIEKLVPHPHADLAFGLRTAKWLPISSSV